MYQIRQKIHQKLKKIGSNNNVQHTTLEIVLHEYQAIYFSIPKVASSTWLKVCAQLLEIEPPEGRTYRLVDFPRLGEEDILTYENYFKFCFVRNPWDRLISCYLNKIQKNSNINPPEFENGIQRSFLRYGTFSAGMSFEEFVKAVCEIPDIDADRHIKSQYTFITDRSDNKLVDFIGKLENANDNFSYVLKKLGGDEVHIPHSKKSQNRKSYEQYYTSKLITIVEKRYAKDIEMFDYNF